MPTNQIWYTSTNGEVVIPYTYFLAEEQFGATIVSNVYKNGRGIITFDGDVTEIYMAFRECSSLESISLPEGITSIGDNAFYGCSSLESITLPSSVTAIGGWGAFLECSSLESITLPEGVQSIGDRTFDGCSSLTSITLPESVTSIGKNAFYNCI